VKIFQYQETYVRNRDKSSGLPSISLSFFPLINSKPSYISCCDVKRSLKTN